MGMTGARINGYDMKKIGLATHFVESKRLEELEVALLNCGPEEDIGEVISRFSSAPIATELDSLLPRINKCFDGDSVEEIYKNLHLDGSDWAMDTIKVLNQKSPTALKLTHRNIKLGKNSTLHDCLRREYRVGIHHCIDSDLKEGVRAILIDKDFKPKWNPETIQQVTEEHVARFFQPLPDGDELSFFTKDKSKL